MNKIKKQFFKMKNKNQ